MTQTNEGTLDGESLSRAAAAVRATRVDGITPLQEGTAYDERLAKAAIEAYFASEAARQAEAGERFDLRRFAVDVHAGRDIRQALAEAFEKLPICPLLALVSGALQEIDALTSMIESGAASLPEPTDVDASGRNIYRLDGKVDGWMVHEGATVYEIERNDEGIVVSCLPDNPRAERITVPEAMLVRIKPLPDMAEKDLVDPQAYLDAYDTDCRETAQLLAHYHALKMAGLLGRMSSPKDAPAPANGSVA